MGTFDSNAQAQTHKAPKQKDRDIHRLIADANKNRHNVNGKQKDSAIFWSDDLKGAETKIVPITSSVLSASDTLMQSKLDGLNDDFARLMAMQQQLVRHIDTRHTQNQSHKRKQRSKSPKKRK